MARVLIVEDDPSVLGLLEMLVAGGGHEVELVNDGCVAEARLGFPPPDAVLLDVMLPGLDGIALLEQMRSLPDWDCVPVLLVSALAGDDDQWRGWRAGATSYVTKPFDPVTLVRELDDHLASAAADTAAKILADRAHMDVLDLAAGHGRT